MRQGNRPESQNNNQPAKMRQGNRQESQNNNQATKWDNPRSPTINQSTEKNGTMCFSMASCWHHPNQQSTKQNLEKCRKPL
jgi:hypothetical protein